MGKRSRGRSSNRGTRSVASLPRGLPVRPTNKRKHGADPPAAAAANNPFEVRANKRLKHAVLNRRVAGSKRNSTVTSSSSPLARSVQTRREQGLRRALKDQGKDGTFVDKRIGEAGRDGEEMPEEERMLRRLVKERVNRSRRSARFDLNDGDDDDDGGGGGGGGRPALTHGGRVIDDGHLAGVADLGDGSSDDDDDGVGDGLTRADTEMHFGGGSLSQRKRAKASNPYGPSSPDNNDAADLLGDAYRSRKTELDDLIERRKALKAERVRKKETQVDTFEAMDDKFADLARLLKFRGAPGPDGGTDAKEVKAESSVTVGRKKEVPDLPGAAPGDTMDEWQMEAKSFLFEKRVRATDRTKTPEEVAQAEAERLHELERRRMARMSGDFGSDDDLSDVELSSDSSDDDGGGGGRRRRRKGRAKAVEVAAAKNRRSKKGSRGGQRNPDELDSSDDDGDGEEPHARFTADGMVYVDRRGNVVKKAEEEAGADDDEADSASSSGSEASSDSEGGSGGRPGDTDDEASVDASAESSSDSSDSDEGDDRDSGSLTTGVLSVGSRVKGNYRAKEQFEGRKTWYDAVVLKVSKDETTGGVLYDLEYDDGDKEENMEPEHVRAISGQDGEGSAKDASKDAERESKALRKKRKKAREEAR